MTSNAIENYIGELPEGWTGGQAVAKWWRGKWVHLYTLRKPCAQCGAEMKIDVTKAAIEGTRENAGLNLTRCAPCRAAAKALRTNSRPRVEGEPPPRMLMRIAEPDPTEFEQLRMANATMKDELKGLYAQVRDLQTRLATYELAPAIEAMARSPANGASNEVVKMPWEG